MEKNTNTPINQLHPSEATQRLNQIVVEAYKRRSRQLPANITDIVATLKADMLKYMPTVSIETIDEAITFETLHDDKTQLSPAFLFAAVRKHFQAPYKPRHWDVEEDRRPDFESDTIALLDTCADLLRRMDADTTDDPRKPLKGSICLPAFNARREFEYLKLRGQVTPQTAASKLTQALEAVNAERIASQHPRVRKEDSFKDPDVVAQCRRLAVLDWLRACNISETTPRDVLMPLQDAATYNELRAKY